MNKNYELLKDFFLKDIEIKKIIYNMRPPLEIVLNDEYLIKYTDKVYKELNYIIDSFQEIIRNFDMNFLENRFEDLKKNWLDIFINCKTNLSRLESFYKLYVTLMKKDLIDSVKKEYIGYCYRSHEESVSLIQSINEMLHVMHSYIINNDNIYESLNIKQFKKLNNNYPVRYYGDENTIFQEIFNRFPLDLDCGWTDIVSFENLNKAIMMIRDRGHALTIEIDIDGNDAIIKYFIPKLCNINMINSLPGVNKVKNTEVIGTTGMFKTSVNDLSNKLYHFISMVPTDSDMFIEDSSFLVR